MKYRDLVFVKGGDRSRDFRGEFRLRTMSRAFSRKIKSSIKINKTSFNNKKISSLSTNNDKPRRRRQVPEPSAISADEHSLISETRCEEEDIVAKPRFTLTTIEEARTTPALIGTDTSSSSFSYVEGEDPHETRAKVEEPPCFERINQARESAPVLVNSATPVFRRRYRGGKPMRFARLFGSKNRVTEKSANQDEESIRSKNTSTRSRRVRLFETASLSSTGAGEQKIQEPPANTKRSIETPAALVSEEEQQKSTPPTATRANAAAAAALAKSQEQLNALFSKMMKASEPADDFLEGLGEVNKERQDGLEDVTAIEQMGMTDEEYDKLLLLEGFLPAWPAASAADKKAESSPLPSKVKAVTIVTPPESESFSSVSGAASSNIFTRWTEGLFPLFSESSFSTLADSVMSFSVSEQSTESSNPPKRRKKRKAPKKPTPKPVPKPLTPRLREEEDTIVESTTSWIDVALQNPVDFNRN